MTISDLLKSISARTPSPGGGAVASCVAALSASLAQMALKYSIKPNKPTPDDDLISDEIDRLNLYWLQLLQLADDDAAAYNKVNQLQKLPDDNPEKITNWPDAIKQAIEVPLQVAKYSFDILMIVHKLFNLCNKWLKSDFVIAGILAEAAVRTAGCNIVVNLPLLDIKNNQDDALYHTKVTEQLTNYKTNSREVLNAITEE